ncbi:hypothetical protein, conserved [Eimeria necatrix]|uniref:Uncharacterized protein n=1 Tax=Eimeria necatrix TaxID=51315 RepID=U6MJW7_9EIME|nr:hypothetical protein, conserved [Eimeria necatrix]CDJ62749.1 hypothetical protein, conserved [Eimeria necatrix]
MDDEDKEDLWEKTRRGVSLVGQILGAGVSSGVDPTLAQRLEDLADECKSLLGRIADDCDGDWATRVQDRSSVLGFAGTGISTNMPGFDEDAPHDISSPAVDALRRGRDALGTAHGEWIDMGRLTAPWLETPRLDDALRKLEEKMGRMSDLLKSAAGACGRGWGKYLDGLKQRATGGGEDAEDAKRRIPDSVEKGRKVKDVLDYVTSQP